RLPIDGADEGPQAGPPAVETPLRRSRWRGRSPTETGSRCGAYLLLREALDLSAGRRADPPARSYGGCAAIKRSPPPPDASVSPLLAGRCLKVRSQRGLEEVYELLGQTPEGAYLHVVYRVLEGRRLRVFHMATMTESQKKRFRG